MKKIMKVLAVVALFSVMFHSYAFATQLEDGGVLFANGLDAVQMENMQATFELDDYETPELGDQSVLPSVLLGIGAVALVGAAIAHKKAASHAR